MIKYKKNFEVLKTRKKSLKCEIICHLEKVILKVIRITLPIVEDLISDSKITSKHKHEKNVNNKKNTHKINFFCRCEFEHCKKTNIPKKCFFLVRKKNNISYLKIHNGHGDVLKYKHEKLINCFLVACRLAQT